MPPLGGGMEIIMKKDYMENLRVVARAGGNKISQQNLFLLKEKYHLADEKMEEMKEYCKMNRILIYDEEENNDSAEEIQPVKRCTGNKVPTEEERIQLKKAKLITKHIMHLAAVSARKRVQGRGWLCGTYTNNVQKSVERYVMRKFDESEMDYIIEHLPEENDEDICFRMVDADNPQMVIYYNDQLNSMIPKLHINRSYSDMF